jgi:hypothetical protein
MNNEDITKLAEVSIEEHVDFNNTVPHPWSHEVGAIIDAASGDLDEDWI